MSIATALREDVERHKTKYEAKKKEHEERHGAGKKEHHRVEIEKMDDGTYSLKGHRKSERGEMLYHEPTTMTAKSHGEAMRKCKEMMCPADVDETADTLKESEKKEKH